MRAVCGCNNTLLVKYFSREINPSWPRREARVSKQRMGMRQDLKLGTAHEEWMLGERQAKQENAPVPPFPYRSSVISITAMQQRHLQRPGARFDCRRPLGWVILHKINPPHIVLTGRGEDRLTCQSRQASLRPRRPLIGAKTG